MTLRGPRSSSRSRGPAGALEAASVVLQAAGDYKKGMKEELKRRISHPSWTIVVSPRRRTAAPIKRLEIRFQRRERRAERDYVDWVLLGVSALLRDSVAAEVGGGIEVLLNPDLAGEPAARASPSSVRPAAWRPSRRRAPPSPTTST